MLLIMLPGVAQVLNEIVVTRASHLLYKARNVAAFMEELKVVVRKEEIITHSYMADGKPLIIPLLKLISSRLTCR
jgi:hypothetical protein